jgi:hypothetical protein
MTVVGEQPQQSFTRTVALVGPPLGHGTQRLFVRTRRPRSSNQRR